MNLKTLFGKNKEPREYLAIKTIDLSNDVFAIVRSTAEDSGVSPEDMDIMMSMTGLEIVIHISKKVGA